nr:hypothetical protein PCFP21_240 [Curtobacterium flaccumfaciens pv. poinsettiae]WQM79202.1 hypothetical protein PCFP23_265 [Curtobacterium flaccumfaciens pv. poinsettiae]WQM79334.1 hypothetical protein PCFP24_420 [Curtobacterium flaccumfaciens pv. poinsettiae]WQM79409.1 hypothetical protein PCFP11_310 [Curtobacterium flaccumfaciens pv. poinsettiae]WQM79444.1 hypothetical protein PCFP31_050 [Curtobacterium flaccumfaciens pv. poinsettiae]
MPGAAGCGGLEVERDTEVARSSRGGDVRSCVSGRSTKSDRAAMTPCGMRLRLIPALVGGMCSSTAYPLPLTVRHADGDHTFLL